MMDIKMRLRFYGSRFSFLLLLVFKSYLLTAQEKYTPESFKNWYCIVNVNTSNDGKYSLLMRKYDDKRREMVFLNNMTGTQEVSLPAVKTYLDHRYFLKLSQNGALEYRMLNTGKKLLLENVKDFYISEVTGTGYLLMKDGSVKACNGKQAAGPTEASDILKMERSSDRNWLLALGKNRSWLLPLSDGKVLALEPVTQSRLVQWSSADQGHAFNFLLRNGDNFSVFKTDKRGNKHISRDIENPGRGFVFSGYTDTGKLIAVQPLKETDMQDSLEVWRTEDIALKPNLNRFRGWSFDAKIVTPETGEVYESPYEEGVTRRSLVFDDQYMLEEMDYANEDFTDEHLVPGIRLINIADGKVELFVQRAHGYVPSRDGKLYYFEGRDWWTFDVKSKKKVNLTASLDDQFYTYNRQNTKTTYPAGGLYFSKNGDTVYLEGLRNVWGLPGDSGTAVNLTRSDDENISFKILNKTAGAVYKLKWSEYKIINEDALLLQVFHRDELKEGLALVKDGKLMMIEEPQMMEIDQAIINNNTVSYVVEHAALPQQLRGFNMKTGSRKVVYSSNTENYHIRRFPSSDLIRFKDGKDRDTYAAVILPPGYDPSKKYPAIVRVYENTAAGLKTFVYPTFYNQMGYNRSLAALNGYITIMPRIVYEVNKPGESAWSAVEEAVQHTAEKYSIDQNKLGLIGESFGGFETNYIISNSKIFKAAVSGVSLSDITASYFSMSKKFLRPNIWRYTDQSYRFSGNFYELKEVYFKQNPVFHADRIEAPLLLWTGKEDQHVNWEQSVAMFIALKSLHKKTELILFPGDGHALTKPENQIQATLRITRWFDRYLK